MTAVKNFFKERKFNIIGSVTAVILMWLVWITAYYCVGNKLIVPSFTETLARFFKNFASAEFWAGLGGSLLRTLAAFLVSLIGAAVCAAFAALSKVFKAILKPVMTLIRVLPTLAVSLIILKLTLGNRSVSPAIVTVLVLFPAIYAQLTAATEGIDRGLTEMAQVYNISRRNRLFKIYLPLVLPNTLSQTGANISLGLKVTVSAEVLVNTAKGLGGMMQESSLSAEIANLAALTLAAVVAGLLLDIAFSQLKWLTYKWN